MLAVGAMVTWGVAGALEQRAAAEDDIVNVSPVPSTAQSKAHDSRSMF